MTSLVVLGLFTLVTGLSITTGVAVGQLRANSGELRYLRGRVNELEDRLQANSLSEFHAARAIAMPASGPDYETRWSYSADGTGLVVDQDD